MTIQRFVIITVKLQWIIKNRSDSSLCNQQKIMESVYMDLNDTRIYDDTFKSVGKKVDYFVSSDVATG